MLYELNDITRTFRGRTVLNIPSLLIEQGLIYTLIGPNGAGKTTLLNILAFLDQPNSGQLSFNGCNVAYDAKSLLLCRREVVLLDQYPILFTGPVWKNVEYGLKIRGVKKADRQQRVREMLDLVGMTRFQEADAHKLSGGETKRVALARALALKPQVLLCDEPGANVDKENQEIILSILGEINRVAETSIIFSTHYLSQGRRLADRTLMLEHGRLGEVVSENLFRAQVVSTNGDRVLCQLGRSVVLHIPRHLLPEDQRDFKVQIDPETVAINGHEEGEGQLNLLSGHVTSLIQDRGRVRLGLDLGVSLFLFLPMAGYLKEPPAIGSKVTIHIPDSSIRCLQH